MKKIKLLLLFLSLAVGTVMAQSTERIQASYLVALGRVPNSGEIAYWRGQGNLSVQQLIDRHKKYIGEDRGTRESIIRKSYVDVLGYNPSPDEVKYHSQFNRTYAQMVNEHIEYAKRYGHIHDNIIKNSYQLAFRRQPNDGELRYWKQFGVISYSYLVSMHEEYKKANNYPSNRVLPMNSSVSFAPVSASVLSETRFAFGELVGHMVAAGGGNMVAAGGGNMVAAGGGNMVAAGGGNMVAAGGGN